MSERHKHADIIIAWANGEQVQAKLRGSDAWASSPKYGDGMPSYWLQLFNDEGVEFRIKPKTVVKKAEVVIYKLDNGGYESCFSFEHIYNAKVVKRFEIEWEEEDE